jgi:phosphoribosylamine--glycine ligase
MRVLLVGGGGREHAMAWALSRSPLVESLLWTPGNGGAEGRISTASVSAEDVPGLVGLARRERIDLVAVGPEVPLALGLADALAREGIACFGPTAAGARLESSKAFSKEFCVRNGIPTGDSRLFEDGGTARAYLDSYEGPFPLVLKADGLAAGKGVLICGSRAEALAGAEEILVRKAFGVAGDRMVVEEFLPGEEASLMVFSDGTDFALMPPARDFKRVGDGDTGPNTGGMGAYCPAGALGGDLLELAVREVVAPALDAMRREGAPFRGVLYAGLMLTPSGPKVLEFNCRFGDPETQVVLPRLETDLAEVLWACATGTLRQVRPAWRPEAAVTVVLCSEGYPGSYPKGRPIRGIAEAESVEGVTVFHAGTRIEGGQPVTSGGRVLNVTALGASVAEARGRAYAAAARIGFEGMHFRKDIAGAV